MAQQLNTPPLETEGPGLKSQPGMFTICVAPSRHSLIPTPFLLLPPPKMSIATELISEGSNED